MDWGRLTLLPDSVLVVVDVQESFVNAETAHVPARVEALLEQRHSDFLAVVAMQFRNPPGSQFRRLIHWHSMDSAPETDLIGCVARCADEVVEKEHYAAGTQLDHLLRRWDAKHVYLCGIDTDVCVLQNAAALFDLGWHTLVLPDACGTEGGAAAQDAAIALLRRTIGPDQVVEFDQSSSGVSAGSISS